MGGAPDTSRPTAAAGFTLLEMLAVLALLGLILALVAPAVGAGTSGAALRTDVRSLAGGLTVARERAIVTEAETLFLLSLDTGRWEVPDPLSDRILAEGTLSGRATVTATTAREASGDGRLGVAFLPDGSSSGGAFVLESAGAGRTVRVDWLTGRVAVLEGARGEDTDVPGP